ncbi:MAG: 8-amino-7-oxononanoate synthase [Pirellulales bacterium]
MTSSPHPRMAWIDAELARLDEAHLRRRLLTRTGPQQAEVILAGDDVVSFASNDYLGLAADRRLVLAATEAATNEGWGAGASPLVTGRGEAHTRLESQLAAFEGSEAALLFPTGFAANQGTIAALMGPGDAVFSDAQNHASIIDGCRVSRAETHIYPHADVDALAAMLERRTGVRRRLIVTDGLFSMDGNLAPLPQLVALADRYDAMLMVDEAHATGVLGRNGRGACEHFGLDECVDVRVGTLSKALGSMGGFVCGSQALVDWLTNRARTYVFSTSMPAPLAAAAARAVEIVRNEPERRRRALQSAAKVRDALTVQGWDVGPSESQIIPVIVGPSHAALALSARLREAGLWIPAIRPPSVPPHTARLRIGISSGHSDEMIDRFIDTMERLRTAAR